MGLALAWPGLALAWPLHLLAPALPLDTPHSFANGTTAVADEVNANFDAVEAAVNALDTQLDILYQRKKLEQNVTSASGTVPVAALSFSGLTPGNAYRLAGQVRIASSLNPGTNMGVTFEVNNGSQKVLLNRTTSDLQELTLAVHDIFICGQDTTVDFFVTQLKTSSVRRRARAISSSTLGRSAHCATCRSK